MKSLTQIFKEKGLKTQAQKTAFIKKNVLVVCANTGSHSYGPTGSIVGWKIDYTYHSSGGLQSMTKEGGGTGNHIRYDEIGVKGCDELSVRGLKEAQEEAEKDQRVLTARKADIKTKLAFLKEAGVDSFTDNEYKAYMTLKTIDKEDLTDVEKAQAIAKLLDQ